MARTAAATARILSDLYDETFRSETFEPYRITWPQLRSLAGVSRLEKSFLKEVSDALNEDDHCLIPFDDFLFFAAGGDLSHYRMVPDRLLEQHLPVPESEDFLVDEDEVCNDEGDTDEDDVDKEV